MKSLSEEQKQVLTRGFSGGALSAIVLALLAFLPDQDFMETLSDMGNSSITSALQWGMLPVFVLLFAIVRVGNVRFVSEPDFDGSATTEPSKKLKFYQAFLQNTLEQCVLAIGAYLAFAVTIDNQYHGAIAGAAILFVIGRILFFRGLSRKAPARAAGFALTIMPSSLLLFTSLIGWLFFD